jgi:uncharacterized protein (TIGR03083 family)
MDPLAALDDETRALSAVLGRLDPADFGRPTNCPPWNLDQLVVHIAMSIHVRDDELPAAAPGSVLATAADYYRRPERDTPAYRRSNVDRVVEVAGEVLAGTTAARWFDDVSRETVSRLGRLDLGRPLRFPGRRPMTLADWVATRVMSVAAHGLDVALTLDREPWTTRAALDVCAPVLIVLLGAPPPAELAWDDHALLAAGTGRRALTPPERAVLGPLQDRFPLLS